MLDIEEQESWFADIEPKINKELTKKAKKDHTILKRSKVHVIRLCKIHGKYITRNDNQAEVCKRCSASTNGGINPVEKEPMEYSDDDESLGSEMASFVDNSDGIDEWDDAPLEPPKDTEDFLRLKKIMSERLQSFKD